MNITYGKTRNFPTFSGCRICKVRAVAYGIQIEKCNDIKTSSSTLTNPAFVFLIQNIEMVVQFLRCPINSKLDFKLFVIA